MILGPFLCGGFTAIVIIYSNLHLSPYIAQNNAAIMLPSIRLSDSFALMSMGNVCLLLPLGLFLTIHCAACHEGDTNPRDSWKCPVIYFNPLPLTRETRFPPVKRAAKNYFNPLPLARETPQIQPIHALYFCAKSTNSASTSRRIKIHSNNTFHFS